MRAPSRHEKQFTLLWNAIGGPVLVSEFRFHATRKWRCDFAHFASKTLIEIEGGAWMGGRHVRGSGFEADCEKYLAAHLAGWRIVRLSPSLITIPNLTAIAARMLI